MRADERYAVESVLASLDLGASDYEPGEDPPDAYILLDGARIPIEVTQLEEMLPSPNAGVQPRRSQDYPVLGVANYLDQALRSHIPLGTIIISFNAPIADVRRFRQDLELQLAELIPSHAGSGAKLDLEVRGNKVGVWFSAHERDSGKRVVGIVMNALSPSTVPLDQRARWILDHTMNRKAEKYSCRPDILPGWLVILSGGLVIFDLECISRAYHALRARHPFERVYVVDGDGEVLRLE